MHAAVVELDALTDPVRTGAKNDHLLAIGWPHLGFILIGRVVIRRLGGKLGRTRIDRLVGGNHASRLACGSDVHLIDAPQVTQLGVGETKSLGPPPVSASHLDESDICQHGLLLGDDLHLVEEPRIDLAGVVNRLD